MDRGAVSSGQMEPDRAQGHLPTPGQATALPGADVAPWETDLDPDVASAPGSPSGDPMERICPYLRSADGTWRADRPDPDHRCSSQSPPAHLPLLAQERFCLSSAHVRCEWFRQAEARHALALEQDGIHRQQVLAARFRPVVRSVPIALDALTGPETTRSRGIAGSLRIRIAAGLAVLVLLALGVLLVLAGGQGGPAATPPPVAGSQVPSSSDPGTLPSPTPPSSPDRSPAPATESPEPTPVLVYYEVQEGETLKIIADRFGIRRNRIAAVNDLGTPPRVETGQVIALPLAPGATLPPGAFREVEVP